MSVSASFQGAPSTALLQQHELQRLLKNLGMGLYPTRPRSRPLALDQDLTQESLFSECDTQVPAGWDTDQIPQNRWGA